MSPAELQKIDGPAPVDFLSHGEIVVNAPVAKVWPAVLDTNGWHGTIMTRVGGPEGGVGERFHTTHPDYPDQVMLKVDNVELQPNRRRTIRIHTPDDTFTGYSTWVLQDRGEETLVSYDVFCRYSFPKEMTPEQVGAAAGQGNAEGLRRLKSFVETGQVS